MAPTVKTIELTYTGPGPNSDMLAPFHQRMVNRMAVSGFKYGPLDTKFPHLSHAVDQLELYLAEYKRTHNIDLLADIANFAGIEALLPSYPDAHDTPTGTMGRVTLEGEHDADEMAGAGPEKRREAELLARRGRTSVDYAALR